MFFFACTKPDDVEFPEFDKPKGKRERSTPFSLSEKGRLVAIMIDTHNLSIVSMLMKKWSRADLDAKAGKKGVAHYWCEFAKLFNDKSYVSPQTDEFADYVDSKCVETEDAFVYDTSLVSELRSGDSLRSQWSNLRSDYALFRSKYDRSGHHNPDPTCYTTDLPTLLMHYAFKDTAMSAWAAKTLHGGEYDDAGDGSTRDTNTRNKRIRKGDRHEHTHE